MLLSPHFQLREFLQSETAVRMGMAVVPEIDVQNNLQRLCLSVLEPVRERYGRMRVTSGYRPTWLNSIVGGSNNSAHTYGCAADIEFLDYENESVFQELQKNPIPGLVFDQIISEFLPDGWVHFGSARIGAIARKQFLVARRDTHGGVEYGSP